MNQQRPTTIQDLIEYHKEKDNCHMCLQAEWWCPQHQFDHNYKNNPPRYKTAVDDGFRSAVPWQPPNPKKRQ